MPVFNYSHSGFWEMTKIFTSDEKHVTNSLIQFLIHCQYQYLCFMWLKTGVTVVKSTFCGGVIAKRIEIVFFSSDIIFLSQCQTIFYAFLV